MWWGVAALLHPGTAPPPCHAETAAPPVLPTGCLGGRAGRRGRNSSHRRLGRAEGAGGDGEKGAAGGAVQMFHPVAEGEKMTDVRQLFFLCGEERREGGFLCFFKAAQTMQNLHCASSEKLRACAFLLIRSHECGCSVAVCFSPKR